MRPIPFFFVLLLCLATASTASGGILTPRGGSETPIRILEHRVEVTVLDGYSRTQVTQIFFNPNPVALEAVYSAPLPPGAALVEVAVVSGGTTIEGEVVSALEAEQIYDSAVASGGTAVLAVKNETFDFRFFVSPVRARRTVEIRFVYLQPSLSDSGKDRYVYPTEPVRTDVRAKTFWDDHREIEGSFSIDVELRSPATITAIRTPGQPEARLEILEDGTKRVRWTSEGARLGNDFVLDYSIGGQQGALLGHCTQPSTPSAERWGLVEADRELRHDATDLHDAALRALELIEEVSRKRDAGLAPFAEARSRVADLGTKHGIVTDHTSMVATSPETRAYDPSDSRQVIEDSGSGGGR